MSHYTGTITEVRYVDPRANSHKYYRTYQLSAEDGSDDRVLFQWGRIGSNGQSQVQVARDFNHASQIASDKIYSKTAKGYEPYRVTNLKAVDVDLLELAGINGRSQDSAPVKLDLLSEVSSLTDRAIRMLTGPSEVNAEGILIAQSLQEKLAELKRQVTQREGEVELVQDLLLAKMG